MESANFPVFFFFSDETWFRLHEEVRFTEQTVESHTTGEQYTILKLLYGAVPFKHRKQHD
jgi:hypothetical protein